MGNFAQYYAYYFGGDADPEGVFIRQFRHLLPKAQAWRVHIDSQLYKLLAGLAEGHSDIKDYADFVLGDAFPATTRSIEVWESQFGLQPASSPAARIQQVEAAWKATGGQSPRYLQDVLQAAGFDVYIHEWWVSGTSNPRVARDPRNYTNAPMYGSIQCGEPNAYAAHPEAYCNNFLANDVKYLVNKNLTQAAPPPIPSDPDYWPFFLYVGGGPTFSTATLPADRREEFERLVLSIIPSHLWVVCMINYI